VFPVDRPLPPGSGDNQALAVNTTDGSVTYDVSFSLVWADGATALNKNEAYAFASCTDCRTVAVAFQVVLVAGQVDVVVPQNLSGALNYACVRCVTKALATQLVVSVPGALSEAQSGRLAAVWRQLQAFGEHIQDVPLAELQSRLTEFEQEILGIVAPGAPSGGATPTTGAVPSGEATTSAPATGPAGSEGGASPTGGATATAGSPTSSKGESSGNGTATSAPAVTSSATAVTPTSAPTTAAGTPSG
jgi:putative peptide zinc metalloprotease protein